MPSPSSCRTTASKDQTLVISPPTITPMKPIQTEFIKPNPKGTGPPWIRRPTPRLEHNRRLYHRAFRVDPAYEAIGCSYRFIGDEAKTAEHRDSSHAESADEQDKAIPTSRKSIRFWPRFGWSGVYRFAEEDTVEAVLLVPVGLCTRAGGSRSGSRSSPHWCRAVSRARQGRGRAARPRCPAAGSRAGRSG